MVNRLNTNHHKQKMFHTFDKQVCKETGSTGESHIFQQEGQW